MRTLWQDVRYGFRMLVRNPGFTIVVVLVLAIGIGANTTIFSVVNSILLGSLPYKDSERLVMVWGSYPKKGVKETAVSYPEYLDWKKQNTAFEHLACYNYWPISITGGNEPERVFGLQVTADLFPLLESHPLHGRTYGPDEDRPGCDPVVVLSYGLWQRNFGRDPDIIGKIVKLDGKSFTVTGVMPPDFEFPPNMTAGGRTIMYQIDLWIPLAPYAYDKGRGMNNFLSIGKLKEGVSLQQAQTEMTMIASRLEKEYPDFSKGRSVNLVPLHEQVVANIRLALIILLGSAGFVLLIVCANIANLLLARATGRKKEMAVRSALGAVRMRLIRQLIVESVLLSLIGGLLGLLLTLCGTDLLVALAPRDIPRMDRISIDGKVFAFTLTLSLVTGLIFGLIPALRASRPNLHDNLKEGTTRITTDPGNYRIRNGLLIAEVALSLILLVGAGLMIKSFSNLLSVDPGFREESQLIFEIQLPAKDYPEDHQVRRFFSELVNRVQALPRVQSVGAVNYLPMIGFKITNNFTIDDLLPSSSSEKPIAEFRSVIPGYFRTMGISLLAGRLFHERDAEDASRVVIISESVARRHWPHESPIGKRLSCAPLADVMRGGWDGSVVSREIVGVVSDVRHFGLKQPMTEFIYFPHGQDPWLLMTFVLKTVGNPRSFVAPIRKEVCALDPAIPICNVQTMKEILSQAIERDRFLTLLLGVFALLATTIASVGIYGIISYFTTLRTHEIGIRIAIGAQKKDILKLFLRQILILLFIGLFLGLAGAIVVTRIMASQLFGVSPTDPSIFTGVSFVFTVVALLAGYFPVRKATKVDPMVALRYE
ncbi:MAG: ABC transporter permease [Phycisphaerae bacterium]